MAQDCRFAREKCHNCGKIGHIKRACRGKSTDKMSALGFKRTNEGRDRYKRAHFIQGMIVQMRKFSLFTVWIVLERLSRGIV